MKCRFRRRRLYFNFQRDGSNMDDKLKFSPHYDFIDIGVKFYALNLALLSKIKSEILI